MLSAGTFCLGMIKLTYYIIIHCAITIPLTTVSMYNTNE